MGKRILGQSNYSANFEVQKQTPLDARQIVVGSVTDLYNSATWTSADGYIYLYNGLVVSVVNTDEPGNTSVENYVLKDASKYNEANSWVKLGTAGKIDDINKKFEEFKATKGKSNGIASLDQTGKVPSNQLPSYVDDVIDIYGCWNSGIGADYSKIPMNCKYITYNQDTKEYNLYTKTTTSSSTSENFVNDAIYVIVYSGPSTYTGFNDSTVWRWSGTTLVNISNPIKIGRDNGNAFPGEAGKNLEDWRTALNNKTALSNLGKPNYTADDLTLSFGQLNLNTGAVSDDLNKTIKGATSSSAGLMVAQDKTKLDALNTWKNKKLSADSTLTNEKKLDNLTPYILTFKDYTGDIQITKDPTKIRYSNLSKVNLSDGSKTDITFDIPLVDIEQNTAGLMSPEDKTKLIDLIGLPQMGEGDLTAGRIWLSFNKFTSSAGGSIYTAEWDKLPLAEAPSGISLNDKGIDGIITGKDKAILDKLYNKNLVVNTDISNGTNNFPDDKGLYLKHTFLNTGNTITAVMDKQIPVATHEHDGVMSHKDKFNLDELVGLTVTLVTKTI